MTVIELGDVTSGSPEQPAPPPRRSDVRRAAVAALAVLCLLTVAGSSRPEPRGLPTLWTMPVSGGQFTLTADTVFVLEQGDGSTIRAYAAADGTPRWSRTYEQPIGWLSSEVPGALLVPVMSADPVDAGAGADPPEVVETLVLDAATGDVRWRQPGEASLATADVVVLVDADYEDSRVNDLRVLRTADGSQAWALPAASGVASWTVTGPEPRRPDRLVTATREGRIQVRRFTDGAVLAEGSGPRFEAPRENAHTYLFSVGEHLYVQRLADLEQTVTAYDLATLKPRWKRTGPSSTGIFDCGPTVCVGTAQNEVDGLDPLTGAVRWHAAGWDYARPVGDGTLLVEAHATGRHMLVDAATGRTLADFGPGSGVVDWESREVLGLGLSTTAVPPRMKVQQLDAASGEVLLRGAVPLAAHGCQLAAGRLACDAGGTLTVTDVG